MITTRQKVTTRKKIGLGLTAGVLVATAAATAPKMLYDGPAKAPASHAMLYDGPRMLYDHPIAMLYDGPVKAHVAMLYDGPAPGMLYD